MDIGPGDAVVCIDDRVVVGPVILTKGRLYCVEAFDDDLYDCGYCGAKGCQYLYLEGLGMCPCGCNLKPSYCPARFTKRPPSREALFRSWQEPVDFNEPVVLEPVHES